MVKNKKGGINMEQKQMILLFVVGVLIGAVGLYGAAVTGFAGKVFVDEEVARGAGIASEQTAFLKAELAVKDYIKEQRALGKDVQALMIHEANYYTEDLAHSVKERALGFSVLILAKDNGALAYRLDHDLTVECLDRVRFIVGPIAPNAFFPGDIREATVYEALFGPGDTKFSTLGISDATLGLLGTIQQSGKPLADIGHDVFMAFEDGTLAEGQAHILLALGFEKNLVFGSGVEIKMLPTEVFGAGFMPKFIQIGNDYQSIGSDLLVDLVKGKLNENGMLAIGGPLVTFNDLLVAPAALRVCDSTSEAAALALYTTLTSDAFTALGIDSGSVIYIGGGTGSNLN